MNLTEDQKKDVVDIVLDCFKYSKDFFTPYYNMCGVLNKLYNAQISDELKANLADDNPALVPPDLHLAVNNLLARIDGNLFAPDPFFRCSGGLNTSEENTENAVAYLKMASAKSELELQYNLSIFSAIKFACGVGYVDIDEIPITSLKNNIPLKGAQFPNQNLFYTDFVQDGTFLCPTYVPCNLRRFFPDPDGPNLKWAIYQSRTTLLDLLQDDKYKFDVDELKKTAFPKGDFDQFFNSEELKSSLMKEYNVPVELLHFRGWMPILDEDKKPKFVDSIITIANRQLLIQFEVNDWHYPAVESFILSFLFPNDMEMLYPAGKIEVSMDSFYETFYIRNQRLINLDRLNNPIYATDDTDAPDYIQAESGRIYKFHKGSKFEEVKLQDISNKAYLEVDSIKEEIRHVFSSNEYNAGIDPRKRETAYGISVLKGASDDLVKYENKIIAHTGLLKILNRYLQMGQLFLEKAPITMQDGETKIIGKKELYGDIGIELKLNEVFNKPVQRQEMLQTVKLYQSDPFIDPVKLRRKHLSIMEFKDVEELVPDPEHKLLPIEKENMMMVKSGQIIPVLPEEDHMLHYKTHEKYSQHPAVAAHQQVHLAFMQKEKGVQTGGGGKIPLAENEPDVLKQTSQRLQPKRLI